jgi:hypothetical protein
MSLILLTTFCVVGIFLAGADDPRNGTQQIGGMREIARSAGRANGRRTRKMGFGEMDGFALRCTDDLLDGKCGTTPFPLGQGGWGLGRLIGRVVGHCYTSFIGQVYGVTEKKRQIILTCFEDPHRAFFCFSLDCLANFYAG